MGRGGELPDAADADEVDGTEKPETVSHFDSCIDGGKVNCDGGRINDGDGDRDGSW